MLRFARLMLILALIGAAGWTPARSSAQEDDLEETVAELEAELDELREEIDELEEDNEDLRGENRELRDENDELRDEIERLETRVEELEGGAELGEGGDGDVPPQEAIDELAGTWVKSVSTAESMCGVFACGSKSEWNDLVLNPDLTYRWGEAPYDEGTYEAYARYGEGEVHNLDVILIGGGGERCVGYYDYVRDTLDFFLTDCPRIFVEDIEGEELVELDAGFVGFVPSRESEANDSPVNVE